MPHNGFRSLTAAPTLLIALVIAVLLSAVPLTTPVANAEPAPPRDSFYDRPAGLAAAKPGQILRTRKVEIKALQLVPVNVDAWQLLYRTTGMNGQPDATVTTVMVPRGQKPRKRCHTRLPPTRRCVYATPRTL